MYFPWDMICINCGLIICILAVNYNCNFVFPQCKDSTFTTEAFLLTIKTAANIDELEAMIEIVDHEIYKQRSRDTNRLMKDGKKNSVISLCYAVISICSLFLCDLEYY